MSNVQIYKKAEYIDNHSWYELGLITIDDITESCYKYSFVSDRMEVWKNLTDFLEEKNNSSERVKIITYFTHLTITIFGSLTFLYKNTSELPTPEYLKLCKTLDKYYDIFMEITETEMNDNEKFSEETSKKCVDLTEKLIKIFTLSDFIVQTIEKCCEYDEQGEILKPIPEKVKTFFHKNVMPLKNIRPKGLLNKIRGYIIKKHLKRLEKELPANEYVEGYNNFLKNYINALKEQIETDDLIIIKKNPIMEYLIDKGFDLGHSQKIYNIMEIPTIMETNGGLCLIGKEIRHNYILKGDEKPSDIIIINDKRMLMESRLEYYISKVSKQLPNEKKGIDSDFMNMTIDTYKSFLELIENATKGNISLKAFEIETDCLMDKIPFSYDSKNDKFKYKKFIAIGKVS